MRRHKARAQQIQDRQIFSDHIDRVQGVKLAICIGKKRKKLLYTIISKAINSDNCSDGHAN